MRHTATDLDLALTYVEDAADTLNYQYRVREGTQYADAYEALCQAREQLVAAVHKVRQLEEEDK